MARYSYQHDTAVQQYLLLLYFEVLPAVSALFPNIVQVRVGAVNNFAVLLHHAFPLLAVSQCTQ